MNLKWFINQPGKLIDLSEKTVVITGANSGIGLETSKQLAKLNGRIVMGCRNEERGKKALAEIIKESSNDKIELIIVDFSSLDSVANFAIDLKKKHPKIDILINNAGIYPTNRGIYTSDGFEQCFQVNFLSHVHLLNQIKDCFSENARIVFLSSFMHKYAPSFNLNDLERNFLVENSLEATFSPVNNYCLSKLAFIYLTRYLIKQRFEVDKKITIVAVNPGLVNTNITNNRAFRFITNYIFATSQQGAYCPVFAAATEDPAKIDGKYLNNCKISPTSLQAKDKKSYDDLICFTLKCLKIEGLRL